MDLEKRILNLIGLTKRAGRLSHGAFALEKAVKGGHSCLILAAADSAENNRKKLRNMALYRQIPFREWGSKASLGGALGRSECVGIAVTDPGLAMQIMKLLDEENLSEEG